MTEASYPSPNHNSRNVTDAEYERLSARFSDDGVWGDPGNTAVVSAGTGLQVLVRAEVYASLRGHAWYSGTTAVPLAISSNASGSTRYDRVVLRLDRSTWDVRAAVLEGTPGAGSVPSLTRDEGDTGVYEIPLASVTVPASASSVTVERRELYVGQRIRPCTSDNRPTIGRPGELAYEIDTGALLLHGPGLSGYTTVHEDTGRLNLLPGFNVWTPQYQCYGRRVGDNVTLRLWYRRVGSDFSSSDPNGSKLGTLPAELVSTFNNFYTARFSNGAFAEIQVRNDGEIWVTTPSQLVAVGRTITATCTYLRETTG